MLKVILNADEIRQLLDLTQPLEVCDESGRVLGRIIPVADSFSVRYFQPQLTEEELQRREQEPEFNTAEMLLRLEKH